MRYDSDMRKEMFNSAEEEFFVDNFIGKDVEANYKRSVELCQAAYLSADTLVERLENGECLDDAKLNYAIQRMIISFKNAARFRPQYDGGKLVNPGLLDVKKDPVEISMLGNQYLGNYGISRDPSDYEKGKWYSLYATNV